MYNTYIGLRERARERMMVGKGTREARRGKARQGKAKARKAYTLVWHIQRQHQQAAAYAMYDQQRLC